jgi:hypothetical protein
MAKRTNIRRRGNSWVVAIRINGRQEWQSFSDREYGGQARSREAAERHLANQLIKRARREAVKAPERVTSAKPRRSGSATRSTSER